MRAQGDRLQDLVAQLQVALRPSWPRAVSGAPHAAAEASSAVLRSRSEAPSEAALAATAAAQCDVAGVVRDMAQTMAGTCSSLGVQLVLDPSLAGSNEERVRSPAAASTSGSAGSTPRGGSSAGAYGGGQQTALISMRAVQAPSPAAMGSGAPQPLLLPRPSRKAGATDTAAPARMQHLMAGVAGQVRLASLRRDCWSVLCGVQHRLSRSWVVHAQALHELLSCVLDSAVQRTPRGGRVQVHAAEQDGRVSIIVEDTGREMAQRLNDMLQPQPSSTSQVSALWLDPLDYCMDTTVSRLHA